MFETGRRTATSTSELGLYSDRSDHYHRNRYAVSVRKYVIAVMVVLAVILISVLLYDFTASATVTNHDSRDTKQIYILQNALKKTSVKRTTQNPLSLERSPSNDSQTISDRSDDNLSDIEIESHENQMSPESRTIRFSNSDVRPRGQNLNNFNVREKLLSMLEDESEEKVYGKQLFDNHAMFHRLKQRYKNRNPDFQDMNAFEESRPIPFHFEYKTPVPTSFKRPKYPQLSQYRYPHSSNNIQDIIKYLTRDGENPSQGIQLTGVYVTPKKFDFYPEASETSSNDDRSEEENVPPFGYPFPADPLYQYKPKHPSEVNLLASNNVRNPSFGLHRYNSYSDSYFPRPRPHSIGPLVTSSESPYENSQAMSSMVKKRKGISVMLDIYPLPDAIDVNNRKTARPRLGPGGQMSPASLSEDYEFRRPSGYARGPKHPSHVGHSEPISLIAVPNQQNLSPMDEHGRQQQMIFHLNLYPKRRNKLDRTDDISKSLRTDHDGDETITSPFDTISKRLTDHSAIETSKFEENQVSLLTKDSNADANDEDKTRYEETELNNEAIDPIDTTNASRNKSSNELPSNHRPENVIENWKKFLNETQTVSSQSEEETCDDCQDEKTIETKSTNATTKDIDTVEGFQDFADGLLATD